MYRLPPAAPESQIAAERRGKVMGRFCKACGSLYPKFRARHAGKPLYGKDHIAAPCSHEGDDFEAGQEWWEPAVEVLAPPVVEGAAEEAGAAS